MGTQEPGSISPQGGGAGEDAARERWATRLLGMPKVRHVSGKGHQVQVPSPVPSAQPSLVGLSLCLLSTEPLGRLGPAEDSGTLGIRNAGLAWDPLDGYEKAKDSRAGRPTIPLQRLPGPAAALSFGLPPE